MEQALAVLADAEPDHDLALLHATLGKVRFFLGQLDAGAAEIDIALEIGEALWLPDVLSEALNTKGLVYSARARHEESLALLKHALELALTNDIGTGALRAYNNLSYVMSGRDQLEEAGRYQEQGIALAERLGHRGQILFLQSHRAWNRFYRGEWDVLETSVEELDGQEDTAFYGGVETSVAPISWFLLARGNLARATALADRFIGDPDEGDVQSRVSRLAVRAALRNAAGEAAEGLRLARSGLAHVDELGLFHDLVRDIFISAMEAAIALRDVASGEEILRIADEAAPGAMGPFFRAQAQPVRIRAGGGPWR